VKPLTTLIFIVIALPAQENIDSLIASWNKLSSHYLEKNELDSACKYGNCAVEMLDQKLMLNRTSLGDFETKYLLKKKAEALSTLVTAYGSSDQIELATECFTIGLQTFKEIDDQDGVFNLYIRMARIYDLRSSYKEALPYYQMALEQAKLNKDKKSQALCYYYIGLNNRYMGNYSEALKNHFNDLRIQEELQNKVGIASAYITIAAILNTLKDRESAIEKLNAAKGLFEEMKDTMGIAMVYNDLGSTQYIMGDTITALQSHLTAARLRKHSKEYNGLGASYNYIAQIYLHEGDHKNAINYLMLASDAFNNASNMQGIMTTSIEMSEVYHDKNSHDSALIWLDKAEKLATNIMNYQGLINIYSNRGEIRFHEQNYKQAISDFQYALSIALQQNNLKQIFQLYSFLAEVSQAMGNYKDAYNYQSVAVQYKDSVDANANLRAAFQLDLEYNYSKEKIKEELEQEKKDALSKAEISKQETQKKLYFAGVVMFLIISMGLFSRLRYIRKSSRALKEQKEKAEKQRMIADTERERATQSEKVKEQFLANMSHEIRTPMNAIKGMTDIIMRNPHPKSQDKYLEAIRQSSESLLVILNEILDLSKLDAGKIELERIPFNPITIVNNLKSFIQYKSDEKGLKFITHIDQNVPSNICGDPTRINQILVNLVNNAVKFTEKGSVRLDVLAKKTEDNVAVLQFKVSDTGIGISKEKTDSIFDAFTQAESDTTRKYGGSGLGLSICKQLVDLYNGSITLESKKGVGSTFVVEIPFMISDKPEQNSKKDDQVSLKDLRILLVEDNEFNVIVAQDELELAIPGVEIEVAENGKVAVAKVMSNTYDLVIMDIQMPEMDGYEATRAIRKLNSSKANIPIMAMTANVMKAEVDRCFSAGMNAYISKPFDRKKLLHEIDRIVDHSTS